MLVPERLDRIVALEFARENCRWALDTRLEAYCPDKRVIGRVLLGDPACILVTVGLRTDSLLFDREEGLLEEAYEDCRRTVTRACSGEFLDWTIWVLEGRYGS